MRTSITFRRLGRNLAGAGLALACAVNAAPAAAASQVRLAPPPVPGPAKLDLGRLSSPFDAAQARKAAGIADTAIDRSLQGGAATASVGFLCGLQPSTQTSGAAGALGIDREGRFLGAQLRLGFR